MVIEAQERIIDKVPADTGELKGSIQLQINSDSIDKTSNDKSGSSTKSINASKAKKLSIGDTANIIAGADHGIFIEQGTSTQPPVGFIARTGNELDNIVQKATNNIDRNRG